MKRIVLIAIAMIMVISLFSCESEKPNHNEEQIIESLKVISNNFYEPGAVRLLDIGDSKSKLYDAKKFTGMGEGYFYGVVLKLQGENKIGGTLSHYYLLRIETVTGSAAAIDAALEFDKTSSYTKSNYEKWTECSPNEYPKTTYKTYEEYRNYKINFNLENYYFSSKAEALEKATNEFEKIHSKEKWDKCPPDEYPKTSFSSFTEYRNWCIEEYYLDQYRYPFSKPYTPLESTPDSRGLYCELTNLSSISNSEEDTYNIANINKSLKNYWDKRLGN